MVLAAARERAAKAMRCARDGRHRIAARHVHRRQHVRLRGKRLVDRHDRGQRRDFHVRQLRGTARRIDAVRGHREHGLTRELNDVGGENGIVALDRSDVVDAGNVGRRQHGDHPRRCPHAVESKAQKLAVRVRADADRGMQHASRLGEVVGVRSRARDMQRGRIMRRRRADDRGFVPRRMRCVHSASSWSNGESTRVATLAEPAVSWKKRSSRLPSTCRR